MKVELPLATYRKVSRYEPEDQHPREAPMTNPLRKSQWRALDGGESKVQSRSIERYPYPPLKWPLDEDEGESMESAGYWLLEGDHVPRYWASNRGM